MIKLSLIVIAVIFSLSQLRAQEGNYNIDSVIQLIPSQQGASELANSNLYLGNAYFLYKNDSATVYYERAYELLKHSNEDAKLAEITQKLGQVYQFVDPVKSTEYTVESVKYAEKTGDFKTLIYSHTLLGNIHRGAGLLEKAMDEYMFCLDLAEKNKDSLNIARANNNIGIVHMINGKYEIGIEYWIQALELKLAMNELVSAASTMANIALYYKDIGRYKEAEDYLQQALEINYSTKDYESISFNYTVMGSMYQKMGKSNKAIDIYKKALDYSDSMNTYYNKEEALLGMSETYFDLGQYKNAFETHVDYAELLTAQYNENNSRIIQELTTKFETEKHKKELILLQSENESKDAKLKEEKARTALKDANNRYLVIGLILAGIVMLMIVFVLYRVKEAKKEIETQKHIVEEKNKEITDSISYAKRLQDAILPLQSSIDVELNDNFVLYLPKDIVAGDFYWMEKVEDEVLIAAADCTGHGVPGALVSIVCHNALNRAVREFGLKDPGLILDKVTDLVIETFEKSQEEVKDGMDICLCSVNQKTKKVTYAGANNGLYILKKEEDKIQEIKANKQPIGKYDKRSPFVSHSLGLNAGDILYLFTDGYADQFGGERGKKMKYKPFREILEKNRSQPLEIQKSTLTTAFHDWKGKLEQVDDVCVIGVRL